MRRQPVYLHALGVWLVFFFLAFSLGAVRERFVAPAIGEHAAHAVGTLIFVGLMVLVTALFVRHIRSYCSTVDLWLIGLLWLVLTVAFEFLFFHYAAGKPWDVLLADYNLLQGRLWVLVPLTELFGPPLLGWLLRPPADRQASGASGAA
jgi:hypothetical protein